MQGEKAEAVRQHYESIESQGGGVAKILDLLDKLDGPLTTTRLAQIDQVHLGGLAATKQLAELAAIKTGTLVLDAGSGFGGPGRCLAEIYGCTVIGVDLTPAFVEMAKVLTARTGLTDRVTFQVGDLMALPFPDAHFDLVWTQHVVMNIPDRQRLYREFHRVLKPSGKLAFFDLFAPDAKPPLTFPVPWAETSETSFLLTKAETIDALTRAGFTGIWTDVTDQVITALAPPDPALSPDGLNLGLILGPSFATLAGNIARNAAEGRVRAVMGVYNATPPASPFS